MKKFLIWLFLFITPIIIVFFLADPFLCTYLKRSRSGELGAWNDIYNGKLNSEVLIYGSSRAWRQIDPKILEDSMIGRGVYNLGMNGHNFYMEYMRHRVVMQHNKTPKCIILSLDVTSMAKRKDLFNPDQFIPYFYDSLITNTISTYQGFDFFDYNLPMVRFSENKWLIKEGVKCFIKPSSSFTNRYKGFLSNTKKWTNDFDEARAKNLHMTISLDENTIKLFDQFLQDTRKSNVQVVLVYSPEFIEGQDFVANRKEIFALYYSFAKKYQVPFLDYSNDSINYDKKYFYNSQHLNSVGVNAFTPKLASDLKRILHK